MSDFELELPFAYKADVRFHRKRKLVETWFSARATVAIPRRGDRDVPVVLKREHRPAHGDRNRHLDVEYRHDGKRFFKPFEPTYVARTEADVAGEFAIRGAHQTFHEYPLPNFPELEGVREWVRPKTQSLSTRESSMESYPEKVCDVLNSTREEAEAEAKRLASSEFVSIDKKIYIACDEPVYVLQLTRFGHIQGSPSVGITCWHSVARKGDNLFLPVLAEARGDLAVHSGYVDTIVDPSVFGFDPVSGNEKLFRSNALLFVEKEQRPQNRVALQHMIDVCDLHDALGNREKTIQALASFPEWDLNGFSAGAIDNVVLASRVLRRMGLVTTSTKALSEDEDMDAIMGISQ